MRSSVILFGCYVQWPQFWFALGKLTHWLFFINVHSPHVYHWVFKGVPEPSILDDLCLDNVISKYFSKLRFGQPELKCLENTFFNESLLRARLWEHELYSVRSIAFISTVVKSPDDACCMYKEFCMYWTMCSRSSGDLVNEAPSCSIEALCSISAMKQENCHDLAYHAVLFFASFKI